MTMSCFDPEYQERDMQKSEQKVKQNLSYKHKRRNDSRIKSE